MNRIERCLLYIVAFVLGSVLLFDWSFAARDQPAAAENVPITAGVGSAESAQPSQSLILSDSQGRPRIELVVGEDGNPRITLNGSDGRAAVSIGMGPGKSAGWTLRSGGHETVLTVDAKGGTALSLSGPGSAHVRLAVTSTGETEISTRGAKSDVTAILRTDKQGVAEIAVSSEKRQRNTSLVLLPSGEMGLRLQEARDKGGPVMQMFADGLSEIAIRGSDGKSGPAMMSLADDVSVISVRRRGGAPGASMVVSPDGQSVIEAAGNDGKSRVALRVNQDGQAGVQVTGVQVTEPTENP